MLGAVIWQLVNLLQSICLFLCSCLGYWRFLNEGLLSYQYRFAIYLLYPISIRVCFPISNKAGLFSHVLRQTAFPWLSLLSAQKGNLNITSICHQWKSSECVWPGQPACDSFYLLLSILPPPWYYQRKQLLVQLSLLSDAVLVKSKCS